MASPQTIAPPQLPAWRRYPVGVEVATSGQVHARVWAPKVRRVEFIQMLDDVPGAATELEAEGNGYFSSELPDVQPGARYKFRLDGGSAYPDPASRFQPGGPHGPSEVVSAVAYRWKAATWSGRPLGGQVVYEMHVGTFTRTGTYEAAIDQLRDLVELGVTTLEMMPVAEFPGRFGWGYDGVFLYAPYHGYGKPDQLRAFVDAAHELGLAVILDVVYNHVGPDGNYLTQFSDHYFKGETEWGAALNFDGEHSGPVREFFVGNAAYWIEDFHFDGLRLDATQQIFDRSRPHIVAEIASRVRHSAKGRSAMIIAENEPQDADYVRPQAQGGHGIDAIWNDDFHHSAMVALTGRDEAYYSGYRGTSQEFVSVAKYGFLYQGEWFQWQGGRRGSSALDLAPLHFVNFIQNHDQIANAAAGLRIHQLTSPSRYRAVTALLLLLPQTPMLFQGQEFQSSSLFLYFADHKPELAEVVRSGRAEFLVQFPSIASPEVTARLPDPSALETFERCKIDWAERSHGEHAQALALVRDLLELRRKDETFRRQGVRAAAALAGETRQFERAVDGSVVTDAAFVLRYFGERPELDRLLVVNLGRRVRAEPFAEPLIAPPNGTLWRPVWSSENPQYGGCGTASIDSDDGGWSVPAESLVVLAPVAHAAAPPAPRQPSSEKEARAQWKARHETPAG